MSDGVVVERHGRVAVITFDRPERRNAIDRAMRRDLTAELAALDADESVRAVVITGRGSAFCAGVDLKDSAPPDSGPVWMEAPLVDPLVRFSKPLIAAINGPAVGGGFEIALCCEIRIASPSAIFQLPEVRIGSMPGSGGTIRIFAALPSAVAWEVLFTGTPLDATRAYELGLVTALVESEELTGAAIDLASRIAEGAPLSLQAIKRAGTAALDSRGLELERLLWGMLAQTEDRAEGRVAFREKRPPEFTGR